MKLKPEYIVVGGGLLAMILLTMTFKNRLINILSAFIPSVEGFKATPYWDESRYSWGYGTAAPGATGTINRSQAFAAMLSYLLSDYAVLRKKVTRVLTVKQWAAFLSFSYNLGVGDALDIIPYINAGNDAELSAHWMQYIHSGGHVNDNLIVRRKKELALWFA